MAVVMQGTWVLSLVWEAPTCLGASKPVSHSYWVLAPRRFKLRQEQPLQLESRPCLGQLERALKAARIQQSKMSKISWTGIKTTPPTVEARSLKHRTHKEVPVQVSFDKEFSAMITRHSYTALHYAVTQSCPTLQHREPHQAPPSMGILQARLLEWVAYPFSRESSRPRNQTRVSCIAGGFFTIWATREAPYLPEFPQIHVHWVGDAL